MLRGWKNNCRKPRQKHALKNKPATAFTEYSALDLDFKNLNGVEVDLGDPVKMLKKLNRIDIESSLVQETILNRTQPGIEQPMNILLNNFKQLTTTPQNVKELKKKLVLQFGGAGQTDRGMAQTKS